MSNKILQRNIREKGLQKQNGIENADISKNDIAEAEEVIVRNGHQNSSNKQKKVLKNGIEDAYIVINIITEAEEVTESQKSSSRY